MRRYDDDFMRDFVPWAIRAVTALWILGAAAL